MYTNLAGGTGNRVFDVLGPTIEFLNNGPGDAGGSDEICIMRGVVPPEVTVPLHSHDDYEGFLVLSGTQQVLVADGPDLTWRDARAGDYVHVPGGVVHAHRNISDEPAVDLIVTTARLGQFFRELSGPQGRPPTPRAMARFVELAMDYGYWLGSVEENASVGIELPTLPAEEKT
ncbi:cupin domain-containing protein [Mycobacterium sherrisii]|uniref:cupin domain-containing protein n=1 Tax=Mycobacterium sherrisii TaxID=243061 RepID=UPI002DDCD19C|nr:cupin domain-containing protein [Mycobacterium sherrisii]MEC4762397.1 cupin domain-containing protein [Mycobacterium sherrisii]